jgi:hypothetical protein
LPRIALKFLLISLLAAVLLVFLFDGYPRVNRSDRLYIDSFLSIWKMKIDQAQLHLDFELERKFIESLQAHTFDELESKLHPIPTDSVGSLRFYFNQREGACYDRAIFMEKFLEVAGFDTRHLYIWFPPRGEKNSWTSLINKKLHSHALLEVKTLRGWMVIETFSRFIAIDPNNQPYDIKKLRTIQQDPNITDSVAKQVFPWYKETGQFHFVYGIYSRHGGFLQSPFESLLRKTGIPSFMPDYNLRMLLYNF